MSAADGFGAGFGEAEVFDLAFGDEVLHCACHVFDGHVGVNAMLVEQVDDVGVEALQRGFGDLLDVFGLAVEAAAALPVGLDIKTELGGDHDPVAERRESFADEFFVDEWAIDFGGVEEGDATFDGGRSREIISFLSVAGP